MMAEQDRISGLPDDVIHRILSFLDMKFVVQTSALSRKWKKTWTTTSQISLNSHLFRNLKKFAEFAKHAISQRNNPGTVSSVKLIYTGAVTKPVVKRIVDCAHSQLSIKLFTTKSVITIPQYFFMSRTLKHLCLSFNDKYTRCCIQNSEWDLPSLETLYMTNLQIVNASGKIVSLFSKCVTLKDITLIWMDLRDLDIFKICAPQLSNLTIKQPHGFPKELNVTSPQLKNLTASLRAPTMGTSFFDFLTLSTDGFTCLQNVNLSMSFNYEEKRHVPGLLELFQRLHNTKCLVLDINIVEVLWSYMDVCSSKSCPFDDLKSLKIDGVTPEKNPHTVVTSMATRVKNYLLQNSPSATFTMDFPQVTLKRSRELVDNDKKAKKVAKLRS